MKTIKADIFVFPANLDGFNAVMKFCKDRKVRLLGANDYEVDDGPYGPEYLCVNFPLRVGGIHEVEEILHAHGGGYVTY